jgi:hypothetical protein
MLFGERASLNFAILTHVNRVAHPATMTIAALCMEDGSTVADLPATWREPATGSICQCSDYTLRRRIVLPQLRDQTSTRVAKAEIESDTYAHIVVSITSFFAIGGKPVSLGVATGVSDFKAVAATCETGIGSNFCGEQAESKQGQSG